MASTVRQRNASNCAHALMLSLRPMVKRLQSKLQDQLSKSLENQQSKLRTTGHFKAIDCTGCLKIKQDIITGVSSSLSSNCSVSHKHCRFLSSVDKGDIVRRGEQTARPIEFAHHMALGRLYRYLFVLVSFFENKLALNRPK